MMYNKRQGHNINGVIVACINIIKMNCVHSIYFDDINGEYLKHEIIFNFFLKKKLHYRTIS